jgi:acetolactate decarboxylase
MKSIFALAIILFAFSNCTKTNNQKNLITVKSSPEVKVVGAIKNVMKKGDLSDRILLDTIRTKKGLYGLGPFTGLKGEILVIDGNFHVSRMVSDSTMVVEELNKVKAPFFVYSNINRWKEMILDTPINSIKELESWLDKKASGNKNPFAFRLIGKVSRAKVHVQNLPEGTKVRSPKDAHSGQVNFEIKNQSAEILGFFSRNHQRIFTHHDSFLHMHLKTDDGTLMGHLDELEFAKMTLYLPNH